MDRLGHVSTLYPTLPIAELAEKLVKLAPGKLERAFFCTSGTEADETAVALAQAHTGRQELIALRHGYSGRSLLGAVAHGALEVPRRPDAGRGREARARPVLLPVPLRPHVPELRHQVRDRTSRSSSRRRPSAQVAGLHRRADPGRRRRHHAARRAG